MYFHINYRVFWPLSSHDIARRSPAACGNTTVCGLEVIRVINDSLGIENKGEDLSGRSKEACSLYVPRKKAPERYTAVPFLLFLRGVLLTPLYQSK